MKENINAKEVTLCYYELKRSYNGKKPTVSCIERKAIEKQKSYIVIYSDSAVGTYTHRLNKSDIGCVNGHVHNLVILAEHDAKKAQKIFERYYLEEENRINKMIADNKAILAAISKMTELG